MKVELIIKLPISWEKIKSPAKATVYNVPTRNGLLGCCLCLQHLVEQEFQHVGKVGQLRAAPRHLQRLNAQAANDDDQTWFYRLFIGSLGSWIVCCVGLINKFCSCARGVFYYCVWTALIKPRLLFFPYKLCLLGAFLCS